MYAPAALASVIAFAVACSKAEPPPPERTEPWPAPRVVESAEPGAALAHAATFRVLPRCALTVELPAKDATPRGTLRVARGELEIDLTNLERTRGRIEIDVASISMDSNGDAGSAEWDGEALAWLDVGVKRPESERERLRWASFTLTSLSELSARAAHEGKRARPDADSDAGDAAATGEERSVTATATGQLSLHGFRVERSLRVRAIFRYAAPAVPGAVPVGLRLELVRPVSVSLLAHDIKPRDAAGVFIAQKTKLLGKQVGKDARVRGFVDAAPTRD